LTHWSRFDVPGMWSLLENVSTAEAFRQAGAWQGTYEAAQSLSGRLRWYRDGLAGKWSPAGSEAAQLYLGRLDELIASAQQLADVAVSNRQALVTLAHAVDEARPKMQRVYEQSQSLRRSAAVPRAGATVMVRQQQLQAQATQIMESLGSTALDSWRHYATADDYQPPQPAPSKDTSITPSEAGLAVNDRIRAGRWIGDSQAEPAASVQPHVSESSASVGDVSNATALTLAASSQGPSAVTSRPISRAQAPLNQVNSIISAQPKVPSYGMSTGAPLAERIGPTSGTPGRSPSIGRAVSSGGVIGGGPRAQPDELAVAQRRSANSVGGVIGGSDGGMGLMGSGGASARRAELTTRRREYDMEDPWYVAEG